METPEEIRAKDILPHKTSFSAGDGFYGDGDTSFFMEADKLLELTAQNALADNVAQKFDPTRDESNKYVKYECVIYNNVVYMFTQDHYGAWSTKDVMKIDLASVTEFLKRNLDDSFTDDTSNWTAINDSFLNTADHNSFNDSITASTPAYKIYYKDVTPGESYRIKTRAWSNATAWGMYNSSGNWIQSYPYISGDPYIVDLVLVVPQGVSRLAVNKMSYQSDFGVFKFTATTIKSSNLEYDGGENAADSDYDFVQLDSSEKLKKTNLAREIGLSFNFEDDSSNWTKVEGYWIDGEYTFDGSVKESVAWSYWYKTGIKAGDKFKITSSCGLSAKLWYFYDIQGNLISLSSDSSSVSVKTETVVAPAGAVKICVNASKTSRSPDVYYTPSLNLFKAFIPYSHISDIPVIQLPADKLYGKTLVCCGDSITYGADMDAAGISQTSDITMYERSGSSFVLKTENFLKSYGYQIAERHNMTFYNDGVSGSTMQGIPDKNGFSLENGRYTTLPDNIDYLTIFFGWNDDAYGTLGTLTDDTNESYFGGYNVVIPYLQNKYPYAKICLIVPFGSGASRRNAVRQLANRWGLSVFDMYGAGTPLYYGKEDDVGVLQSVVTANRAKFQANGAHPNYQGHKQIADMLEQHLLGI